MDAQQAVCRPVFPGISLREEHKPFLPWPYNEKQQTSLRKRVHCLAVGNGDASSNGALRWIPEVPRVLVGVERARRAGTGTGEALPLAETFPCVKWSRAGPALPFMTERGVIILTL